MNRKIIAFAAAASALTLGSASAHAATANASAGAKIIAPLQVSKSTDLYFGTIAPSLVSAGTVLVGADGSRNCGPQLTCLTADHTAASFQVTGEMDASYVITLPGTIQIANSAGNTMDVYDFASSKASGLLAGGTDSFSVGGTLGVNAAQAAGVYTGSFTVGVEYN